MDVDIVKASSSAAAAGSDSSSMDMMAMMMMQMEKFPDLSSPDPFYTTTNDFSNSTITLPTTFSNPALLNPIPTLNSAANFVHHHIPFQQTMSPALQEPCTNEANKKNSMAAMREMIFRVAVMQPVHIDPESIKPPKRRNVRISKDPQSVAARHRRERISERIRILQRLVPGGTKMDTASMLDEAIHYVKFLKKQVQSLEQASGSGAGTTTRPLNNNINNNNNNNVGGFTGFLGANNNYNVNYSAFVKGCHHQPYPMVGSSAAKQLLS